MAQRKLEIVKETFPLARPFRISRGVKSSAELIRVTIHEGKYTGEGECCPYARYGESIETVFKALEMLGPSIPGAALGGIFDAALAIFPVNPDPCLLYILGGHDSTEIDQMKMRTVSV